MRRSSSAITLLASIALATPLSLAACNDGAVNPPYVPTAATAPPSSTPPPAEKSAAKPSPSSSASASSASTSADDLPDASDGGNGIKIREANVKVTGALPPEVVIRTVRANYGLFRICYEKALHTAPTLGGAVKIKFVIAATGSVTTANDEGSNLPDPPMVECLLRAVRGISFPSPQKATVTAIYPMTFAPQ